MLIFCWLSTAMWVLYLFDQLINYIDHKQVFSSIYVTSCDEASSEEILWYAISSSIQMLGHHLSITSIESIRALVCILHRYTGHPSSIVPIVAILDNTNWNASSFLPWGQTVSRSWGRDCLDGGWGRGRAHRSHIDDWFTGRLQCTEIIPLAAQLAWTWSMIGNILLQSGWTTV